MATQTAQATVSSVLKEVKQKKFAPVYFLFGDEPYFIDSITEAIEKNALVESEKSFNQVVMYGKDVSLGAVINNARRFPMMAERVVVIIKEAQSISDWKSSDATATLEKYLQNPQKSTVLVFAYKAKTFDKRSKIGKVMSELTQYVECKKISDNKLFDFVREQLQEANIKAKDDAIQVITENIGNDPSRIHNEIAKLALNLKAGEMLSSEMVHQFIGISREYNIFELQKALVQRNPVKCNQIIQYFAKDSNTGEVIGQVALLYSYFTKILAIHAGGEYTNNGAINNAKVAPFLAGEYLQAARTFPLPKTIQIIGYLKEADLRAKGVDAGSMGYLEIMQELVFKIIH